MSIFYLNKIDNITLCSFQVYNKMIWFYMYCEISLQNDVTINLVNIHHHQVSLFIFLSSATDLIISFSLGAHAFPKLVEKKFNNWPLLLLLPLRDMRAGGRAFSQSSRDPISQGM